HRRSGPASPDWRPQRRRKRSNTVRSCARRWENASACPVWGTGRWSASAGGRRVKRRRACPRCRVAGAEKEEPQQGPGLGGDLDAGPTRKCTRSGTLGLTAGPWGKFPPSATNREGLVAVVAALARLL